MNAALEARADWRRGEIDVPPAHPVAQEYSLHVPLGYAPPPPDPLPRIGVFLHAFHTDLLAELRACLDHMPFPADLCISTDSEAKRSAIEARFNDWPRGAVQLRICPNRGRDVAPKLVGYGDRHADYDLVLHVHTKQSPHDGRLAGWRGYLLETLLGSAAVVRGVVETFSLLPGLGMLGPQHVDHLRPWIRWSANFDLAAGLAARMGFAVAPDAPLEFPAGSMFWARPAALAPLLDLRLTFDDFPAEAGQTDGTTAHAIERLYYLACERAGFDWFKIAAPAALHERFGVTQVYDPAALRRLVSRRRVRLADLTDQVAPVLPALATPPKPRRLTHPLWRRAAGEGAAPRGRLAIVAAEPGSAAADAPEVPVRAVAGASPGGAVWRNAAMHVGGAAGADIVLMLDAPGRLAPGAAGALLRMHAAQDGRALLEAAALPRLSGAAIDPETLAIDHAAGPALAVPRAVFEAVGPFDAALAPQDALADYAARARRLGLALRHCPGAWFAPRVPKPDPQRATDGAAAAAIDMLVRLEDAADLPLLRRCVFALLAQDPPAGSVLHLLLGRFSGPALRETRAALQALRQGASGCAIRLHNWVYPEPHELGVPLLNWGLEQAMQRYLTCLEPTDLLLPGALRALQAALLANPATGLATGILHHQPALWWGEVVLPQPGGMAGASRLFLIDRHRVPARALEFHFDPGAAAGDAALLKSDAAADLLQRLAGPQPEAVDPVPIGLRQVLL